MDLVERLAEKYRIRNVGALTHRELACWWLNVIADEMQRDPGQFVMDYNLEDAVLCVSNNMKDEAGIDNIMKYSYI